MAVSHIFTNSFADFTGTVTAFNSQGSTTTVAATNLVRPSDWNSVHNQYYTVGGNTTQGTTASGTNVVLQASGPGISIGATGATVFVSAGPAQSFYVPYWPMSTNTQTMGAIGVSTASALIFPVVLDEFVSMNHLKLLFSASVATTTVAASQTISSVFGIYSNNAGTLSSISTGSFSVAVSQSSVSGTVSFPTSTGTGGYGYGTSSWSTTAQAQSLFGTAGNRKLFMQFGGDMLLAPNNYYIGLLQRQSTVGAAAGLSTALVGAAMPATTNVGPWGQSTANFTSNSAYHFGAHGMYTSTGSAGYSGTTIPATMLLSGFNNSLSIMPLVSFAST